MGLGPGDGEGEAAMTVNGLLTDIRWSWNGSDLSEAVTTGGTVLQVDNPTVYAVGDQVAFADDTVLYAVTGIDVVDDDNGALTIDPPLVADWDVTTTVVIWQGGQPGRTWVGEVVIPEAEEPIEVVLKWNDRITFTEGQVEPPKPITLSDDLETIVDLPSQQPLIAADAIDPSTIPSGDNTPTEPPATSPTLFAQGTVNAIILHTLDVAGTTTLEYHVSVTEGFTPDSTTLLAETRSQVFVVTTLPDGTALALGTTY